MIEFQFAQLIYVALVAVGAFIIWQTKNVYVTVAIVAIMGAVTFLSPITTKNEGMAKVEQANYAPTVVPERVVVEKKSFEQRQQESFNKLKLESEGIDLEN